MLRQRILSALVFVPILFAAIWFGGPWLLSVVVALVALGGVLEFYGMAGLSWRRPLTMFGVLWTVLFSLSPCLENPETIPLLLTSAVVFSLSWLLIRPEVEKAFINWGWTLGGMLYVGWMLGHFVSLRVLDYGKEWVILALFAAFAVDTSAFLAGRALGRHKLALVISPGKSWEGVIGGFFGGLLATVALTVILGLPISHEHTILLGFLISGFAQLGDLAESLLKRSTGVKDSGRLIPGHGGILDRLDSVVFTVVVVYYYLIWVIG